MRPETIRLFVGFDADQAYASQVFAYSFCRRSSLPVAVSFVMLAQLRAVFNRPRDPVQSTDHAFTRFLVPWLCGYEGRALFCDGDMLCLDDPADLWAQFDARYAVQVVQRTRHEMTPDGRKFLGHAQTAYPRKNWSSVMLFNNPRCRRLDPDYVGRAPGLDLHQLAWLPHDYEIGPLPALWNHLVGVDAPNPGAKLVHYTLGMPALQGWRECEYAAEWRAERDAMLRAPAQFPLIEPHQVTELQA